MKRSTRAAVVALLVGAAAAGCSSSAKTGNNSSATSVRPQTSTSAASDTGGSPIKVGFVAPTSGPQPLPTELQAIQGAEHYISTTLGGVNGRALKVYVCQTDGAADTNVYCANTFIQDGVDLVLDGSELDIGAEQPILDRAGISIMGIVPGSQVVDASKNDFYFGPAFEAFAAGSLQVLKTQGGSSIALTSPDSVGSRQYVDLSVLPAAKKLGVKVAASFYNSQNTDWAVIAGTLAAAHAGVVGTTGGSESECTSLLEALRAAKVTAPIFLGGCSAFLTTDPKQAPGVLTYAPIWEPDMLKAAPPFIQRQLKAYDSAMAAVGHPSIQDQHAVLAFAALVDTVDIVKMVQGAVTAASVKMELGSLKNFQPFLTPPATCNHQAWPGTSSCIAALLVTKVSPGGQLEPVNGTGFSDLNPNL